MTLVSVTTLSFRRFQPRNSIRGRRSQLPLLHIIPGIAMKSQLPRKALISLTSHSAPYYPDGRVNDGGECRHRRRPLGDAPFAF